jgi:hypothetical protein
MPPRRLAGASIPPLSSSPEASKSFICLSCSFKNAIARQRFFRCKGLSQRSFSAAPSSSPFHLYRNNHTPQSLNRSTSPSIPRHRSVFTIAATTSVNAPSLVSPQYRPLYDTLSELGHKATAYVSLARVKSALSSLEAGEKPSIRIAILGLNGHTEARNLVRLLLADCLSETQSWETLLKDNDERGLLVR